jgi:hypothetical protein
MDRTLTGAEAGIVAPPQLFPQQADGVQRILRTTPAVRLAVG